MDVRKKNIDNIQQRFTYLKNRVEIAGSLNLTDIHIHAEIFYRDLFKKLGYSFKDTNFDKQNSAFIDLIDKDNKVVMQVTAQNDSKKISSSIQGFYSKPENKKFSLKVLLISKNVKDYTKDFTKNGKYNFDKTKDIIDLTRLIAEIKDKETSKIVEISNFLDDEILIPRPKTESNEVETIMTLIDFLSNDKNRAIIDRKEIVDPEMKIYTRFSEHSEFLISQYQSLYSIYSGSLNEAKKKIDTVKALIISSYLKDESDELLNLNNNDSKLALKELVDYFSKKLSESGFPAFDKQAIRFYLLDEIINCNVFPNKVQ